MDIQLYDTTLRDGAQQEGISLSDEDKLKITRRLDELGVHYVEGGWPGSNPKDADYFRRVRDLTLSNAQVAAFGSTRRAGVSVEDDGNVRALMGGGDARCDPGGQELRPPRAQGAGDYAGGEPGHDRRYRGLLQASWTHRVLRRRALLRRFHGKPEYTLQTIRSAAEAGADSLCCATPTAVS